MSIKEMKLFADGEVKVGERVYTRLIGGFGDNKPVLPDKLVAELLGYAKGARAVRQRVNENIEHFTFGLDILDLKSSVPEQDTIRETLKTVGYTEQSINLSKVLYVFSEAGFLLFLKFAEGDKAITLYKDFIEDYFRTKAENEQMKKTIEEEIKELTKDRYKISGLAVFQPIEDDRVEAQKRLLNLDDRIAKLKSTVDNKSIREALEKQAILIETKNKNSYLTQSEFGTRFNNKIGAKYIGKLLKIVGLAKKSYGRTVPYQEFVPNMLLILLIMIKK